MDWFKQWRYKIKNNGLLEVSLAKLEFLTTEFLNDRDRKVDVTHWRESLKEAERCSNGKTAYYAVQAYRSIFTLYARKYNLSPDLEMGFDELIDALYEELEEQ